MKNLDKIIYSNQILRKIRDHYNKIYDYRFEKYFKKCDKFINSYYNRYKGSRCFIIATGPSLNKTNMSLIKDEISFGVNTFFNGIDNFKAARPCIDDIPDDSNPRAWGWAFWVK